MPRLSTLGSAVYGQAGEVSIDGSTPALLATFPTSGPWDWISPTVAFGPLAPNFASTDFSLYRFDPAGPTKTLVDHYGANGTYVQAGGGSWAAWVSDGRGCKTGISGLGPFPAGYMLAASEAGELALETSLNADSGIKIYNAAGVQIDAINGILTYNDRLRMRAGIFAYSLAATGWRLRNYLTLTNLSMLQRGDGIDQFIPLTDGSDIWVLERNNVENLTLRKKDDATAWLCQPPNANEYFYPDAISLSAGVARITWSNTLGEVSDSLFVQDITLATGANTLGTVVAGALVFVAQAALGTVAVTGTLIPESSGGGGGGGIGGPGSPGRAVTNARVAPPPAVKDQQRYPHVPQIQDFAAKQSTKLLWDQTSRHQELIATQAQQLTDQAARIAALETALADLTQNSTVTFKGVQDV